LICNIILLHHIIIFCILCNVCLVAYNYEVDDYLFGSISYLLKYLLASLQIKQNNVQHLKKCLTLHTQKTHKNFIFKNWTQVSYMIYIMVKFPMNTNTLKKILKCYNTRFITNFMGHNLTIIVMQNLIFIGSYEIDMDVIHLLVCLNIDSMCIVYAQMSYACSYCLNTNVACLFVLFTHESCARDFRVWIMHDIHV